MRQVVIVAPHFPPSNLAAVHRTRLFAMHLPKFGWRVRVLSVDPRYYEEPLDPELTQLVPPDVEVMRTRAFPVSPVRIVGDIGIRSLWWHYRALNALARRKRIDLVYIPIPPNFSALLGPLIYRCHGIPYAIDYIDPWVHAWPGSEVPLSKAWLSFHLGRLFEPLVLRHVRLITAVAPGYYEGALQRSPWLEPSRCMAMPYGAEAEDFRFLEEHPRPTSLFDRDDGNRHIVYAGAMLPRAHTTLEAIFRALLWARDRAEQSVARLRLHFIGTGTSPTAAARSTIRPLVERLGLSDLVWEHPARLPYLEVLNHLKQAHAVLVFGSDEPHYTASKVFQAVSSHRLVIGILHARSTAATILTEVRAGPVITFDEERPASTRVEEIGRAFLAVVGDHDLSPQGVDWVAFASYSAEEMTKQLAAAFTATVERSSSCNPC